MRCIPDGKNYFNKRIKSIDHQLFKVLTGFEFQFVMAVSKNGILRQPVGNTAILVGDTPNYFFPRVTGLPVQHDLNAGGRFAHRGI